MNEIKILTDAFPINWDLHFNEDYASKIVLGPVSLPLFIFNNETSCFEQLACKDYICSEDGCEHIFILRSDLKWSNGDKITSEDYGITLHKIIIEKISISFFFAT